MINKNILKQIKNDDKIFNKKLKEDFLLPEYNSSTHYKELTRSKYFQALIVLRHYFKVISDYYFGVENKAKNVDLFMITSSVSSPMGPGSDSEVIPIKFGEVDSFLVDSSQFGFEPLLMNGLDIVYCYLPSMRGENPDKRHLNQFFHCEAEIKGDINKLLPIIEGYIKTVSKLFLSMPNIIKCLSLDSKVSLDAFRNISIAKEFPQITFDEAVDLLLKNGKGDLVRVTESGRDISSGGEIEVMKILGLKIPLWIKNYDRDRVPFYQKPDSYNKDKAINADLIFPPLIDGSFGGEIVGCGQRQDNDQEMLESLKRQNIPSKSYDWYIDLRKLPNYQITSGFGLGVERLITWALCRDNIRDAIIYPRLKNNITYP
ncbi:MAG: amino acid--tRNA ligase-related protein [Candidatus Paceibacterota bacterium]|jgi:asparaginyl-tRNA synthetase